MAQTNGPRPAAEITLSADDVHVWVVPLDAAGRESRVKGQEPETSRALDLADLAACLSTEERKRAKCFLRDEVRRRFVVAHAALRTILGRYLAAEPQAVTFYVGPHGKPSLEKGGRGRAEGGRSPPPSALLLSDLRFNLAHSGELALVAVTRGCEIGVDVERLRPVRHLEQLAQRYFAPAEAAAISASDQHRRLHAFLATWTAKEAVLKVIGKGLTYPLDRFVVSPTDAPQQITLTDPPGGSPADWWLERIDGLPGYLAAVATSSRKLLRQTLRYPLDLASA